MVADSYYFDEEQDPDPDPDPHYIEKLDPGSTSKVKSWIRNRISIKMMRIRNPAGACLL